MGNIIIDRNTFDLSFDNVKNFISNQSYLSYYSVCAFHVDMNIEDDRYFGTPLMNVVFYQMLFNNKRIPTWQEFLEEYKIRYCKTIKSNKMIFTDNDPKHDYEFYEMSLDKKLIKAYISFLKEIHILSWFIDKNIDNIFYSLENDIAGFDISIMNNNHLFGIKICPNTYKVNKFINIKKLIRNISNEDITVIGIKNNSDNYNKLGDTNVFHEGVLKFIYNYILNTKSFDDIII